MEKNWKYEDEELLEKEFQAQVMEMKQKYEEIPVPAHARDRMLAGIRQAKEEKERRSASDPGSDRCNCGILLCSI